MSSCWILLDLCAEVSHTGAPPRLNDKGKEEAKIPPSTVYTDSDVFSPPLLCRRFALRHTRQLFVFAPLHPYIVTI